MLISNADDINLQPFNPSHASGNMSSVLKSIIFAILAFIGFEAAAPMNKETHHPQRTIPHTVTNSAILIKIFYIFCAFT